MATRFGAVRRALAVVLLASTIAGCSQRGEVPAATASTQQPTDQSPTTTTTTEPSSDADTGRGTSNGITVDPVEWTKCGNFRDCATVTVPLDYDEPDGATMEIALARRPARDSTKRIGSMFINPGGPGGSGIETLGLLLFPAELTERFDVVGFDPRGVGQSTPLSCGGNIQELYDADPTMDDQADLDHYRKVSQDFVDTCARSQETLPHLGTENVARDLDMLRAAVGDDRLTFVGFSYGTSIGQQYARLFPRNVRALVLDGVVDVSQSGIEAARGQAAGFAQAMAAYAADCDAERCLPGPAREMIDRVMASAERTPITASGADRPATPGVVTLAVAQALYSDLLWSQLTRALNAALDGEGTALVELADEYLKRQSDGSYSNTFDIYFAVNCLDSRWPTSFEDVIAAGEETGETFGPYGEAIVNDYARCPLWPVAADPLEPVPTDIVGLPPIVFISSTGDPATPYEQGVRVAAAIPDARHITYVGQGHTIFAQGSSCIDGAVNDYLVSLEAPPDGLRCD